MGKDNVQLETVVSTISYEYLLEFTSEYGISEALHPKLRGPEDRIVDFPEGKIHLSQLSVIGAAKVSHFKINCRVLNIVPTLSLLCVFYTPSFNSGWMSFSKRLGKNTPQCYTKPLDSLNNWNNRFFWVDERAFPTIVDWRTSAPKDGMPTENTYSPEAVMILNTHHTPIQKQPEALLCLVGLSRRYYLGDEVYPTFLHDDDRDMDLFNLIRAPNPTKVKTGSHPCVAHEVPLLIVTANRVIEIEDLAAKTDSSGVPSTIERSPLDFANENPSQQLTGPEDQEAAAPEVPPPENVTTMRIAPEAGQAKRVAATGPPVVKERRKRSHDEVDTNAPPKVSRRDHADPRPTESTREGKSLAAIELGMGSTRPVLVPQGAPVDVSDPDPLSFVDTSSRPSTDVTQSSKGAATAGDPESENTSFISMVGSHESIYRPEWGITNGCLLDAPEACQDLQYNVNLARQVAIGSQLRLRFEQEAKLLKKSVSNNRLSQQVSTLQAQVMGEEKLKAAFEEFKKNEHDLVEQRCAEMDARLDALSIDFDEELYPHMLTAIAGRRWVIERGLRLAVMKCGESTELRQAFTDVVSAGIAKGMSEGLKHGVEHEKAKLDLEAIEAYDPEAEAKYIAALHALKNLKYPLVDQLESLKDAPMDVIMASLHMESDTGDDAPQWIHELRPSSSQLTIPVYPEARDPMDPWACKEEILLACYCGQR
nr:transposase (putative), gypsy type [Tanacetum cinerariifolium]